MTTSFFEYYMNNENSFTQLKREECLMEYATSIYWNLRHSVLDENSSEKLYLTVKAMDFLDYGINVEKT